MPNPALPQLNTNALAGIAGRAIEVRSPIAFPNPGDAAATLAAIGAAPAASGPGGSYVQSQYVGPTQTLTVADQSVLFTAGIFTVDGQITFTGTGMGVAMF